MGGVGRFSSCQRHPPGGVTTSGNSPSRSVSHINRDGVESTDALSLSSSSSQSLIRESRDAGGVGEVGTPTMTTTSGGAGT